jgi:hypothetical protein
MTENISNLVHDWCSKNLTEATIQKLDHDPDLLLNPTTIFNVIYS